MKPFLILSLPFFILLSCSTYDKPKQNGFIIDGELTEFKGDSVFLENTNTGEFIGAKVDNGKFQFKGKIEYPESYMLSLEREQEHLVRIFVENSNISITGSADSLGSLKIQGSKSYDEYISYRTSIQSLRDQMSKLDNDMNQAMENNLMDKADSLGELYQQAAIKKLESVLAYAERNNKSPIIPFITGGTMMDAPDPVLIEKIFSVCDTSLLRNPRVAGIREMVKNLNRVPVGSKVPDFELTTVDGKKITPSSLKGKVVLLDFWASWCAPCRKNHPDLVDLYKNYKGKNFEIVSVSIDKLADKEKWERAIQKDGLTWPQVCDFQAVKGKAAIDFGIEFIPAGFLIGPDGTVVAKDIHRRKLREKIDELLTQ